jgi:RNA polymerase sigma-70 factor (ECF subfamily)
MATVRRVLGDEAEAEDVAQEGLLRLWRSAGELTIDTSGVRPWLRRVVSNLAIDRIRSRRRLDVTDNVPEVADPATQDAAMGEQELAGRVEAALAGLPERQRIALSLFHLEDMSQREVAERMGISEDALESLLARGRRSLKAQLADEWRGLIDGVL